MKQLKFRALAVLFLVGGLVFGTAFFLGSYMADGAAWASSRVNASAYSGAHLARGALLARDGELLYDAEADEYAANAALRKAALHLTGDRAGNIGRSAAAALADRMVGFSPLTGLSDKGHDVYLTVDADLQSLASSCLSGQKGAAILYDYRTGEVLCAASAPTFDPLSPPMDAETNPAYDGVYLNRAFSGLFAPGSVFKLVTATAAVEKIGGLAGRTFTCTGRLEFGEQTVTCPHAHGEMDFATALAHSCNCAFAELSLELGGETLRAYAEKLGLLTSFSVSGIPTAAGSFSVAESEGDLAWSGVGQYTDMVCPAAMLRLVGGIANGGVAVTPRLFLKETGAFSLPVPTGSGKKSERLLKAETADCLRDLMRNNVTVEYGNIFGGHDVGAKSGTAEVGEGKSPHAWFVGFVAEEEMPVAFAVIVQNGGAGLSVAGNVAAKLVREAERLYTPDEAE